MATGQASTLALYNWHLSEQRERERGRDGEGGREEKKRGERQRHRGEKGESTVSKIACVTAVTLDSE